jgi:hypothetical protein
MVSPNPLGPARVYRKNQRTSGLDPDPRPRSRRVGAQPSGCKAWPQGSDSHKRWRALCGHADGEFAGRCTHAARCGRARAALRCGAARVHGLRGRLVPTLGCLSRKRSIRRPLQVLLRSRKPDVPGHRIPRPSLQRTAEPARPQACGRAGDRNSARRDQIARGGRDRSRRALIGRGPALLRTRHARWGAMERAFCAATCTQGS